MDDRIVERGNPKFHEQYDYMLAGRQSTPFGKFPHGVIVLSA
jgi:hypothetical protein